MKRMSGRWSREQARLHAEGFTLIEIAVATTILAIVVLILSQVFHQSSLAWTSGMRKASGNMTGRTAMSLMARDLMNAAADPDLLKRTEFTHGGNSVTFPSFGAADVNDRAARLMRYDLSDNQLRRSVARPSGVYGQWLGFGDVSPLVTNVGSFVVETSDGANYSDGDGRLPEWVRLRLTMKTEADVSRVDARSLGRDGRINTADDIKSF
jgi:prepilin-type N-terminal cleavage/methylation domain-containing protein